MLPVVRISLSARLRPRVSALSLRCLPLSRQWLSALGARSGRNRLDLLTRTGCATLELLGLHSTKQVRFGPAGIGFERGGGGNRARIAGSGYVVSFAAGCEQMIVTACLDRRGLVPKGESRIIVAAFHILQFDSGAELDGSSDRFQGGQGLKRTVNLSVPADSNNPLQAMQHLARSSHGLHAAGAHIHGPIVAEG